MPERAKSQRNEAKNGVVAEDFTQKSLLQTIRPCTSTDDELFRPSLTALTYEIAENYEVIVVFDASIRTLLGINDQQIAFGFPLKVRVHVVANKQTADQTILEMASNPDAYVISNDRFRDFTDKSAVNAQRLFRHEILAGKLLIHDLNIAITYD